MRTKTLPEHELFRVDHAGVERIGEMKRKAWNGKGRKRLVDMDDKEWAEYLETSFHGSEERPVREHSWSGSLTDAGFTKHADGVWRQAYKSGGGK